MGSIIANPAHLLESHDVGSVKLELLDHWQSIIRLGVLHVDALEPIERHEGDSTQLLLVHDFEKLASGFVIVNHDVEETFVSADALFATRWHATN